MEEFHATTKKGKTHPRSKASFLSQLFLCWQLPIFWKGFKKELNEDDLYDPLPEYDSKMLTDKLEKNWQVEVNFTKNPSLWRALIKTFGLEFMLYGLLYLPFECFSVIMQPFGLKKLLDYYTPHQTQVTKQEALVYSGLIVISITLRLIVFSWHRLHLTALAMKIRIACSSLIYRKSLTLKQSILQEITVGHIVNLLSSDVLKFDLTLVFLHFLWMGPVDAILLTFYLYFELGPVTVISLGLSVPCLALLYHLSKKIASGSRKTALKTDYRIRFVNDIVCGIKTIKMYTWEKPFSKLIRLARASELDQIKKVNFLRFHGISAKIFMSKLFVLPSLVATILTGVSSLTSQYVFVLISCCEILKTALAIFALRGAIMLSELCISVERIQHFLLIDKDNYNNKQLLKKSKPKVIDSCILKSRKVQESPAGIYINNASVKWDSFSTNDILKDIKFEALPGELVGVIGSVGSGKSTLLQTILNETAVKGTLVVGGLVSYAPQEPWVFSASVRQNILFGQDMDRNRYLKVVQICALEQDFLIFPDGDRSLVGERGVKLSGGQKSRIGLARAVYRNADIYLLDDPLSAVDAQVGNQIFRQCIVDFLKDKCVVLVTHQLKYLGNFKKIYIVEEGSIKLTEKNQDLNNVIVNINKTKKDSVDAITISDTTLPVEEKEHRSKGLSYKAYRTYCQAGGNWLVTFANLFLFFLIQFTCNFYDYFLAFWVNLEQNLVEIDSEFEKIFTTMNCIYISIVLLLLLLLLYTLVSWSLITYTKNASKNIHNNLLNGTLNATMKFFNNHSSGRILNRFAGDIGVIDETIPLLLGDVIIVFFILNGAFVLVAILNVWMLIPVVLIYLITFFFWKVFEPASKHIKKTESITKSPILTHLVASLEGLSTIRAFRGQSILEKEFDNHQNPHSSASYLSFCLYFALGFWCEFVSLVYMALTIFGFFLIEEKTNLGYVALGVTQSIHLIGYHQYWIRTWAELDTVMTSVERVEEYSKLPIEKDDGTYTPPETWPNTGNIIFQSVSMKYSEKGSLVLKKLSFQINSGAKIGIVGRTGAGKSSLISVLFRLFYFEGKIFIDGIDTKRIPLNKLRSQISIIPQEPVLFLGTLRKNLDPFDEFTDEELWNTLEKIELKGVVTSLDSVVSEGGTNFSVGQRQLICLGRVMLRKNKIIILDEATANVDLETDELIQKTIKEKFEDCTVLTIAHRVNTVMDSDKVLVLKAGEVVEFDHPSKLLQNENSLFYHYVNMCE